MGGGWGSVLAKACWHVSISAISQRRMEEPNTRAALQQLWHCGDIMENDKEDDLQSSRCVDCGGRNVNLGSHFSRMLGLFVQS